MTPRLKILTAGLVLSLIYAISDYITRNSDKPVVEAKREVKKRAKTARIDQNRINAIRAKKQKKLITIKRIWVFLCFKIIFFQ